jgi:hypothetical protein
MGALALAMVLVSYACGSRSTLAASSPGCSRPAVHCHHIEFRSQGGSDDPDNQIGLCAVHHLRRIHAGLMRVTGQAPDKLVWEFGLRRSWAQTAVP